MMYAILGILLIIISAISIRNSIKLNKAYVDIDALETGKDELQDSYEQQFLSHLEKISMLQILNYTLEQEKAQCNSIIEYHARKCHGLVDDTIEQIMESLLSTHDEPAKLVHNHPSYETCDANLCSTDRYVDGVHVFADVTVDARPISG